ncbi:unnamed protein product [Brassicogethes aeneus]|uniref:Chitin-binding type-4 domain-containing protein n=1 Tax=Brassicogethes aeneus TaxID=1431903 RepID=A0A9P0B330_BRAAE|nr:unnamed protein product [Brassicogethes aeneus]
MYNTIYSIILLLISIVNNVRGHGRLMDPPARNSMWRFGFPNPVNYNDNELFCGGYAVQWEQNEGKCGVCGDPYHVKEPRPHEATGIYAKGIVTRHYSVGQEIDIEVELTANHYGRFEIFLCPNNNPGQVATQDCLDRYPLHVSGTDSFIFEIPEDGKKKAVFRYNVQLPPYLTCTQCVLQWTYYTGNQWGMCENGTQSVGCGKSETFRNCADVAILSSTGGARPPLFVEDDSYLLYYKDSRMSAPYNVYPLVVRDQVCVPHNQYRIIPGMRDWCQTNCLRYPPNCPTSICECPTSCEAVGEYEGIFEADVLCMDQCLTYGNRTDTCPREKCHCFAEY